MVKIWAMWTKVMLFANLSANFPCYIASALTDAIALLYLQHNSAVIKDKHKKIAGINYCLLFK
ncbi:MAG: hypothetical protein LBB41_01425 [Prevotellaceae bacterium]|jgi:hypothetical protein|nr:hypothetical protein [Prevotellaceae bacterium]